MTPKEKAEELVEKFIQYTDTSEWTNIEYVYAKKCALIAVDEILQHGMLEKAPFMANGKDLMKGNFVRYKDYWLQVKTEIEAL
jgi:hypothetical protein